MKSFHISTNSKFMRLTRYISGKSSAYYRNQYTDLCRFIRHLLFVYLILAPIKLILMGGAITVVAGVLSIAGQPAFNWLMGWDLKQFNWYWIPVYALVGATYFIVGICLIGGFFWTLGFLWRAVTNKVNNITTPEQPTLVSQAYRSWKDKYCTKVDIK